MSTLDPTIGPPTTPLVGVAAAALFTASLATVLWIVSLSL